VLDKLNEVQKVLKTNIKQIETENKKISETQSNIKDIEFRIANLEGQNQALLEMLANLQEEGNKQ
jgi:septal ring factor EnvC (AmiA/AmiB activator)